jgi:hypothetical protein
VLLGLEPCGDRLASDPALPAGVGSLAVRGIPGRWGRANVVAEHPVPPSYRDIFLQWFAERGAQSRPGAVTRPAGLPLAVWRPLHRTGGAGAKWVEKSYACLKVGPSARWQQRGGIMK